MRDLPRHDLLCPHCSEPIDVMGSDIYLDHTTYWGDDAPKSLSCPHCDVEFFIQERVTRTWVAGRTPKEASDA